MNRQSAILLAAGTLVVGLVLGFAAGGISSRWMVGRAMVRSAMIGPHAPGYYYAAPAPFTERGGPWQSNPRGFSTFGRGTPFLRGRAPQFRPGFRARPSRGAAFAAGARVVNVVSGGPADNAGVKAGDVITAVGGTTIDPGHTLASLLQADKPGEMIELAMNRAGQTLTVTVTLGASPQSASAPYLGIRYGPVLASSRPAV